LKSNIVKRKNFSFEFTKDTSKFIILVENYEKIRSRLYKVCEVCLNIKKVKIDLKVAKVWKFWDVKKSYNILELKMVYLSFLFYFIHLSLFYFYFDSFYLISGLNKEKTLWYYNSHNNIIRCNNYHELVTHIIVTVIIFRIS